MKNVVSIFFAALIILGMAIAAVTCIQAPLEMLGNVENPTPMLMVLLAYAFMAVIFLNTNNNIGDIWHCAYSVEKVYVVLLTILSVLLFITIIGRIIRI